MKVLTSIPSGCSAASNRVCRKEKEKIIICSCCFFLGHTMIIIPCLKKIRHILERHAPGMCQWGLFMIEMLLYQITKSVLCQKQSVLQKPLKTWIGGWILKAVIGQFLQSILLFTYYFPDVTSVSLWTRGILTSSPSSFWAFSIDRRAVVKSPLVSSLMSTSRSLSYTEGQNTFFHKWTVQHNRNICNSTGFNFVFQ